VLVVGVLALFSADVARLLLGPEFREGHRVLPIAMAGSVAWQLGLYAQKPLEFAGRVRTVLAISVVAAASNVAINVVMVPRFGYVAAAYATLVAYAVYALLAAFAARRVLRWAMRWKELAGTLALSGAGLGLAWAARALAAPSWGQGVGLAAALAVVVPVLALVAGRMLRPLLGKA
jgi:O-antigen/teichoic acid export membrane protein